MAEIDVRALRSSLNLTQERFADCFGFNVWTVRKWEQGLREPQGYSRTILLMITRDPALVRSAVAQAKAA